MDFSKLLLNLLDPKNYEFPGSISLSLVSYLSALTSKNCRSWGITTEVQLPQIKLLDHFLNVAL